MNLLLRYLAVLFWPRKPAPPPDDGRLPPGLVVMRLGGGWQLEACQAVIDGRHWIFSRLVCPSRKHWWPWVPRVHGGAQGWVPQEKVEFQYEWPN